MKKYVLMSFCIYFVVIQWVYAEMDSKKKENKNIPTAVTPIKKEQQKIKKKEWPPTFIPSEKIGADSSIAFPIDI